MPTQDNIGLSPSEKLTLRYIAEGELHPHELAVEPQQVVLGEAEAADGCVGF